LVVLDRLGYYYFDSILLISSIFQERLLLVVNRVDFDFFFLEISLDLVPIAIGIGSWFFVQPEPISKSKSHPFHHLTGAPFSRNDHSADGIQRIFLRTLFGQLKGSIQSMFF
jgi:hypothetical protein